MTIYDLLRRFCEPQPLSETERRDAAALIGELERMNVLGTMAREVESQDHECVPNFSYWRGTIGDCIYCNKPVPGWEGRVHEFRTNVRPRW